MGEFLGLFERLNNDLKLKLSLIGFGLFMPSLIYYVLLFTNEFLNIDLTKVIIICICINFIFILSFTFIGIVIQNIIRACRNKFIINCRKEILDKSNEYKNNRKTARKRSLEIKDKTNAGIESLEKIINSMEGYNNLQENEIQTIKRVEQLNYKVNELKEMIVETSILSSELDGEIEKNGKDINEIENQASLLLNYYEGFTDIILQLAISSGFHTILVIYLTLYKLFSVNNLKLTLDVILLEGCFFHVIYILVFSIVIIREDIKKVKRLKKF